MLMDPSLLARNVLSSSTFGLPGTSSCSIKEWIRSHASFSLRTHPMPHSFLSHRCGPCVRAGPELSELSEKYAGRVAIVGVNNESMFRPRDEDLSVVTSFLEEHKKDFRYTIYVD